MTDCDALLAGIVSDPLEETRWLVLADWLEEHDDPRRAELLRLHRKMLATCCEPDAHPERSAWQARMTELLVAGVRPCVPQETLTLPGGVPMTFSFIPPGAFLMGSETADDYEKPVHRVEVPQGFFLGAVPVTQAQWLAVMGTDPSHFKGAERPVEMVTWDRCQEFCSKLSVRIGRGIELPTEAEWEYACRAGTTTRYHFGDAINTGLANYEVSKGDRRKETTPVGSFLANGWGLFDVHGNVWEWCRDELEPYAPSVARNPRYDGFRVLRGGSWFDFPSDCISAYRFSQEPYARSYRYGFRVRLRPS